MTKTYTRRIHHFGETKTRTTKKIKIICPDRHCLQYSNGRNVITKKVCCEECLNVGTCACEPAVATYGFIEDYFYVTNTNNNLLLKYDRKTYKIISEIEIMVPGETVSQSQSIAYNPADDQYYALARFEGSSARHLINLNVQTGVATDIGTLPDSFSSITFSKSGTLYGVTGDGASTPETLYIISLTDATTTLLTALGNGGDGEIICYNPDDGYIYHWSGNGSPQTFEKINPKTLEIKPITNTLDSEVSGALYLGNGQFLIVNLDQEYIKLTRKGVSTITGFVGKYSNTRGMAAAYDYQRCRH